MRDKRVLITTSLTRTHEIFSAEQLGAPSGPDGRAADEEAIEYEKTEGVDVNLGIVLSMPGSLVDYVEARSDPALETVCCVRRHPMHQVRNLLEQPNDACRLEARLPPRRSAPICRVRYIGHRSVRKA